MKQLIKEEGRGNIALGEAERPDPGPREVLVRTAVSLISRGSEIGGRFRKDGAVDAQVMGYSATGEIVELGSNVSEFTVGQRVSVIAPHAEFVTGDVDAVGSRAVTAIPDGLSYDHATFHSLAVGSVLWTEIAQVQPHETVVVYGQGLVGNLVLQAVAKRNPDQLIAIDAIPSRLEAALDLGANVAIDGRAEDAVARVRALTGGAGADLVIECVGGPAGVHTFPLAVRMTRGGGRGRIHLIGLYHEQPLPLDSGEIQGKTLLGGYVTDVSKTWRPAANEAMRRLANGEIRVDQMITHRFSPTRAKAAFDLLHDHPSDALGVLLDWRTT
jgi:threonine dehydrogenase-like Zn-dependent dehydrogenase